MIVCSISRFCADQAVVLKEHYIRKYLSSNKEQCGVVTVVCCRVARWCLPVAGRFMYVHDVLCNVCCRPSAPCHSLSAFSDSVDVMFCGRVDRRKLMMPSCLANPWHFLFP